MKTQKHGFTLIAVLFCILVFASVSFAARGLYDDFSAGGLDEYRWGNGQFQREIMSGVLKSRVSGRVADDGFRRNRLPIANPNLISDIKADVSVVSGALYMANVDYVAAQIEGIFYKATNGQHVWAGVFLGDQGLGLEAWWAVVGINPDQSVTPPIAVGPIAAGTLNFDTFYPIQIIYNSGTNTFTFMVNSVSQNYQPAGDYARAADPDSNFQMKSLTTVIWDQDQEGWGDIRADFDNVYVNGEGTAYDQFSTSPIDGNLWWGTLEFLRQVTNPLGNPYLQLDLRNLNPPSTGASNNAPLRYDNTPYLEAQITVRTAGGLFNTAFGRARIAGYYYNESRGPGSGQVYNSREGDVFVEAGLEAYLDADGTTRRLKAYCRASVSNADETSYTGLFSHDFATGLAFDAPHTFSILFTGTAVTCSYDGTGYTYNIATPVYEPSESTRMLASRIWPGPGGGGGYLRANYDDVYVDFLTISGTIVDESNDPVPGVSVGWWNMDADIGNGTASAENGTFTLEGVPPGPIGFRAMPDASTGLAWYQDEFYLDLGQSLNLGTIKLKQGALVSGILKCFDNPEVPYAVGDAELWYGGKFELGYVETAASGTTGYFELRLPVGQYRLNLDEDSIFTMVPLQISITDINQTDYENMTLDAYDWSGDTIVGNVSIGVSYTGQAMVLAFMGNEQFSPETWGGMSTVKETQPDGAGDYFLMVPPSSARAGQGVIVALGTGIEGPDSTESFTVWTSQLVSTPATDIDFSWNTPGYKVEGCVKDANSMDPVFYSQVLLYKVGTPDVFTGYATTDGDGRYTIHNVPAGTYKLAAISRDYPTETVWSASFTITSADILRPDIFFGEKEERIQADFNGDGKVDILWRNKVTGQIQVWLMNGLTQTPWSLGSLPLEWEVVGCVDFNADGKSDVLWRNGKTGKTSVWLMDGESLVKTNGSPGTLSLEWEIKECVDFNGDGRADILWRNKATGQVQVWLMNGLTQATWSLGSMALDWEVVGSVDFNADGKSDVLWRNGKTGKTSVWLMDGESLVKTNGSPGTLSLDWEIKDGVDFNGDGNMDVLWRNKATGQVQVWLMNGLTQATWSLGSLPLEWEVVGCVDFNADGKSDVLWRNAKTGKTSVWLMDGESLVKTNGSPGTLSLDWEIKNCVDFSGDGNTDILWRNKATGQVQVWLMDGLTQTTWSLGSMALDWDVVECVDFDSDGDSDVLWRNAKTGKTSVWLMDGESLVKTNGSPGTLSLEWDIPNGFWALPTAGPM